MDTLGERIRILRGERSQKWLAEKLGIPSTTLSNYENNKSELNFAMIGALKTIFCVNTDWLLFGEGSMEATEAKALPLGGTDDDINVLKKRIAELEAENSELKEEAMALYKDALSAYKRLYETMPPESPKEGMGITTDALASALPAPSTNQTSDK